MINNITFFETPEDIIELTGASREELWELGFNLDDMDCGFCVDSKDPFNVVLKKDDFGFMTWQWENDPQRQYWNSGNVPFWFYKIITNWESYCVGYHLSKYKDKTYVTLHHT